MVYFVNPSELLTKKLLNFLFSNDIEHQYEDLAVNENMTIRITEKDTEKLTLLTKYCDNLIKKEQN